MSSVSGLTVTLEITHYCKGRVGEIRATGCPYSDLSSLFVSIPVVLPMQILCRQSIGTSPIYQTVNLDSKTGNSASAQHPKYTRSSSRETVPLAAKARQASKEKMQEGNPGGCTALGLQATGSVAPPAQLSLLQ